MKKLLFALLCLFLTGSTAFAQNQDISLAKVNKVNNKLIFYENEPLTAYDVVFTFQNDIGKHNDLLTSQIMDKSIINASRESANQGKAFDAIIVQHTTQRDIAIKFKDSHEERSTAKVKRMDGVLLFVNCEPLTSYQVVEKYKSSKQLDFTHISRLIKRGIKNDKVFNGIIYGTTGKELLINLAYN